MSPVTVKYESPQAGIPIPVLGRQKPVRENERAERTVLLLLERNQSMMMPG